MELLFELFEFGWWDEAEFAKGAYQGRRGIAPFIEGSERGMRMVRVVYARGSGKMIPWTAKLQ